MGKGKHIVANGVSDEDANLDDDYHDLFVDNADLVDEEDVADLDGVANLDGTEMDGVELDGGEFDGADLNGAERDGANLVSPDVDVPESSNSRRGANMGARKNKRLKTNKGKIVVQYNEMGVPLGDEATELASFLELFACTSVSILYSDWHKVPPETKERLWKFV